MSPAPRSAPRPPSLTDRDATHRAAVRWAGPWSVLLAVVALLAPGGCASADEGKAAPSRAPEATPAPAAREAAPPEPAAPFDPRTTDLAPWGEGSSRGELARVAVWVTPGVLFNEPFHLDLMVRGKDDVPFEEARVTVSAWMPDHGHGMSRHPRVEARGGGWYRVTGMLLHMAGHWDLYVDVVHERVGSRVTFPIELE